MTLARMILLFQFALTKRTAIEFNMAALMAVRFTGNNIDHPTHGRTAILRRAGTGNNFDMINVQGRHLRNIHGRAGGGGDGQPIHQNQHPIAIEALQVHLVAGFTVNFPQLNTGHNA